MQETVTVAKEIAFCEFPLFISRCGDSVSIFQPVDMHPALKYRNLNPIQ